MEEKVSNSTIKEIISQSIEMLFQAMEENGHPIKPGAGDINSEQQIRFLRFMMARKIKKDVEKKYENPVRVDNKEEEIY